MNNGSKGSVGRVFSSMSQYMAVLLVLLLIVVITSIFHPVFLTGNNLLGVLVNNNSVFLTGFGMTFVILAAGIDLSVGSMVAFSGMIAAWLLQAGFHPVLAIPLTVAAGWVIGMGNGFIIARFRVPAFVVTLGSMTILRGLAVAVNGGYPIPIDMDSPYIQIGNGNVLGVPAPILTCILAFVICYFILVRTNMGRNVYAIGGNAEAARLSGISVLKTSLFAYGMCSALSALAGVLLSARMYSGLPSAAEGLETQAVASVILGGTSFTGGDGNISGTILGVLLLGYLLNAMVLFSFPSWLQNVIQGAIIVVAVVYDKARKKNI